MVRYTLAVAGEPSHGSSGMVVSEKVVDIMHNGQLDESFLLHVNPKGQVPALTSDSLAAPIIDSMDITEFICTRYPSLMPASHQKEISKLLKELHSISYYSLSFSDKPFVVQGALKVINERLARDDISDSYRKALTYKRSIVTNDKLAHIQPDFVKQNDIKVTKLLQDFESHLPSSTPWLFDLPQPTALDAHLVVFIARLKDIKRLDLVPERILAYASKIWEGQEWRDVMQGRKTMFGF